MLYELIYYSAVAVLVFYLFLVIILHIRKRLQRSQTFRVAFFHPFWYDSSDIATTAVADKKYSGAWSMPSFNTPLTASLYTVSNPTNPPSSPKQKYHPTHIVPLQHRPLTLSQSNPNNPHPRSSSLATNTHPHHALPYSSPHYLLLKMFMDISTWHILWYNWFCFHNDHRQMVLTNM